MIGDIVEILGNVPYYQQQVDEAREAIGFSAYYMDPCQAILEVTGGVIIPGAVMVFLTGALAQTLATPSILSNYNIPTPLQVPNISIDAEQAAQELADQFGGSLPQEGTADPFGPIVPDYVEVVDGAVGGKIPLETYTEIRLESVHNAEADSLMLGKYTPTVTGEVTDWTVPGPDSYIAKAGTESTYFSMGSTWDELTSVYHLSDDEMFDYFNRPVLDEAIESHKTIKFSHYPLDWPDSFLIREWEYIKQTLGLTDEALVKVGDIWYVRTD